MIRHNHPDGFDPECKGCQPVLFDAVTGEMFADDHPHIVAMRAEFAVASKAELDAYYRVTVKNSRTPVDQMLANGLFWRVQMRVLK